MTSYLWPSSPLATITVLIGLYCLPMGYLGLLSKFYIITYLVFMLIGYLFSLKRQSRRLTLVANQSSYAIVTGASSGIGAQICRHLVRHDFNLIMVARSQTKLNVVANECRRINDKINIHIIIQDLVESNAVENLINKIDALKDVKIDIIINNAGRGCSKPFFKMESNDNAFEEMLALHVRVPTLLIRHYLPKMLDRPSRIVNISSEISYISSPRAALYASTKAFLTQLTTSLDYEIEQLNDTNNNVSLLLVTPGPTLNTEFDRHDQSVVFRLPFVTLTAEKVAKQIVDSCLRGDRFCTPGWANQLTIWLMTKVPLNFAHLICCLLWASWSEVKQWLHERRHLVIICFNLVFFLLVLACFLLVKITRQLYYRFF
jgi:short-subunit dehydrogenase